MALVFVLLVALFVVLFLFVLPILFSLQAVGSLFVYPRQLKAIIGNRILRRNHALEHATIVVMMEREPGRKLNGFSTDAVFFLGSLGLGLYLGWPLYLLILGSVALAFALRVPLSLLLQRFVTTDADLSNAEVGWVERANPAELRGGIVGVLLAASTVRVRVFHTDPDAVEIVRDDGAVVR